MSTSRVKRSAKNERTSNLKRNARLNAGERRLAILAAAAPIIAQSGLHGTSVREIAEAAGVSEALLYKHFPSKRALYDEALALAREFSRFTIARFATQRPSTESFVLLTYATIHFIVCGFPGAPVESRGTERLIFQSLLDDGVYARQVFADTAASWMDYVLASYHAAIEAGDLKPTPVEPEEQFRFVQQLAMALRLSHLPDPPAISYSGTPRDLADHAVLFSLKGLGLSDSALEKYFRPEKLQAMFQGMFPVGELLGYGVVIDQDEKMLG